MGWPGTGGRDRRGAASRTSCSGRGVRCGRAGWTLRGVSCEHRGCRVTGVRRDYAVFSDDRFVTNAMLTRSEAEAMELEGFRCLVVTDAEGEGLPRFRGQTYVTRGTAFRHQWRRD